MSTRNPRLEDRAAWVAVELIRVPDAPTRAGNRLTHELHMNKPMNLLLGLGEVILDITDEARHGEHQGKVFSAPT